MKNLLTFLVSLWLAWSATAASKPNIIFIMADDLGYTDIGPFGTKY